MDSPSYQKLTDEELAAEMAKMRDWSIENGMLTRSYEARSYMAGLEFAMEVGRIAETIDHHPDILISYKKVRISVSTHSAGGITQRDFDLARRIEDIDYATGLLA
jgi:4a-hydroxytetrahydrobiopterin dehydratase